MLAARSFAHALPCANGELGPLLGGDGSWHLKTATQLATAYAVMDWNGTASAPLVVLFTTVSKWVWPSTVCGHGPTRSTCTWEKLCRGTRNNIHGCSLLRLDLGTCTLLTLPTPGVETCRAAGPNKPASQHAPCGPYAWVSQAVHTVENQAVHADWHQQPHHPQGGVTPALVSADEHVLGGQPGT